MWGEGGEGEGEDGGLEWEGRRAGLNVGRGCWMCVYEIWREFGGVKGEGGRGERGGGGLTKVCVYSRLFMEDQDNSFKEVYLLIRLP